MAAEDGFGSRIILLLGVMSLCAGAAVLYQQAKPVDEDLAARVIQTSKTPKGWKIFHEPDVQSGATIPADTNVVFHLPLDMQPTSREVLLGQEGDRVRYWGYCFADNFSERAVASRTDRGKLPGLIFLSEAERAERDRLAELRKPRYSVLNPPITDEDIAPTTGETPIIRHQLDIFQPGMICYIMTADALAISVDSDGDLLNNKLERDLGTKVDSPDTDEDGITDGVEHLHGLFPKIRDSDNDGLVDGIEDKNWNGRMDRGETNPLSKDSDKDGLCDGSCRVIFRGGKEAFLGEDLNLDGQMDDSETDPLKWSTRNDGVSDEQAYFNCELGMKQYCK